GYTLRATGTGLTVTSAPFTIVAGSATQIAVNAGDNQTQPAGTAVPIRPSVIVKDSTGNPVAGVAVTFAVAPGNGSITGASQTTNASGIATVGSWTLATAARTNTLTAASTGLAGSPVQFIATGTAGDAGSIALHGGNGQSATVGTAVATVPSVIVRDQFNNPVAGVSVTFAVVSGGGTVVPTTAVTTNAGGIATVTSWTLGTTAGTNTLRAISPGLNGNPVDFTATGRAAAPSASRSLVAAVPGTIAASAGSSAATITVTVRDDFDNPVSGASVTLSATGASNALTQPVGTTNASGQITGTLSSTAAGTKTVTATVNGTFVVTETAAVTVTAGAVSASQSTVAAAPTSIAAGSATSTITVTAKDAHGNPIEGATVVLAATPTTGNALTQPVGTTNASGVATGTLASTAAGDKTVSATINNSVAVAQTVTVTVTPGGVSASQSTVVAAPTSIAAGSGSSTITVTARDASGNPIQGVTVTLAASPAAGSTLTQAPGTTNASGVATGTLSSTAAGLKTVSATIGPVAITQTATVTVTAGAAAVIAGNSMNPQSATVGTAVDSRPSVIVRDAGGNPVAGVAVTFAVAAGNGSITGANQTTNASGIATVGSWTLPTAARENTLTATAAGSRISGNPVTFTATGTAGAATQLVITTPPSISAQSGVAFLQQPVIQLQDASSNPVSQAGVVVTATVSPAGATASSNSATTGTSGAATFSGLA
ncbi:MAG TPA: Ig-like domain-containing protein, partial [Gemmatimonadales bacterium]|nr:Ig-like domain-containing protein [Gemmatimonadales bacterium]